MNKTSVLTVFILLPVLIQGCAEPARPPDPVLERFKDYYTAECVQREISRLEGETPERLAARLDSVRSRFGFSSGERDSLLGAARDSLPRWEEFLNDVLQRLERREGELRPDSLLPPENTQSPTG